MKRFATIIIALLLAWNGYSQFETGKDPTGIPDSTKFATKSFTGSTYIKQADAVAISTETSIVHTKDTTSNTIGSYVTPYNISSHRIRANQFKMFDPYSPWKDKLVYAAVANPSFNQASTLATQQQEFFLLQEISVSTPVDSVTFALLVKYTGGTAGTNYNGIAIYQESGAGLVKIDSTATDSTIWRSTINTATHRALGKSVTLVPGVRYYGSLLYNATSAGTAPQCYDADIFGNWLNGWVMSSGRYFACYKTTSTTMPYYIAFSSMTGGTGKMLGLIFH